MGRLMARPDEVSPQPIEECQHPAYRLVAQSDEFRIGLYLGVLAAAGSILRGRITVQVFSSLVMYETKFPTLPTGQKDG